jgi:ubiquinone/menaquinone biosynthesis C-methylase UbiE
VTEYLDRPVPWENPGFPSVLDELSLWSSRFGTLLLDHLELVRGIDVLDLGCGAGFPLFELAQMHGRSSRFAGVDPWAAALERARFKLTTYALPHVLLVRGDGARLPFGGGAFDLIVSNLGVNNFEDARAVLGECARVARPSARIALTTNVQGHMREFYGAYRETLHELGRAEAIDRLNAQEQHRTTKAQLSEMLESAGFRVMRVVEDAFTLRYLDGAAMLRHFFIGIGFLDGWRGVLDPADERAVFAALERKLDEWARREGELRLTVPMLYVEGRRS